MEVWHLIKLAHNNIIRIKGKEYSPNVWELQNEINSIINKTKNNELHISIYIAK